jgi:hypothetical protein
MAITLSSLQHFIIEAALKTRLCDFDNFQMILINHTVYYCLNSRIGSNG